MSSTLPSVDWAQPPEDRLAQLERQMVRGSHFTQAALDRLVARLAGAEAYITELVDVLCTKGLLADGDLQPDEEEDDDPDVDVAPPAGEDGSDSRPRVSWPGIAFRVDPEDPRAPLEVDCETRMSICHAVCCKLNFALTPVEVESGTVKWDLGFLYLIRQEANGYCTHNDTTTGCCSVYANRPGVCRRYSCANDKRIWKDFDAMELNEEWIRENLSDQNRILMRAHLPVMDASASSP